MLYIVATPIGNLKDMTFRAVEVLQAVDLIACEDTRHARILLGHYRITTPTTSFFSHNQLTKTHRLLQLLKEGKSVALISDAGMPGILDPGYHIINQAIDNGIEVTVLPGPTAFINALVLSGKPAHEFVFAGFLPTRSISRRNKLAELAGLKRTIVFYESCHRIAATLDDVATLFGERQVVVARELTKKFEEVVRGSADAVAAGMKEKKPRGEFVVVV